MLRDAGVRGKLFAVLAIPTLLLVVTAGWLVGGQMQAARQAGQVQAVTDVAIQLNRVVHNLQSERNVSLRFLQDSSAEQLRTMLAQRADTNAALRVLRQKVVDSPIADMSESIKAANTRSTSAHTELVGARKSIDAGRFFATETDVFYSKIIAADLQLPGVISASASPDLAQRLQAEQALSTAVEYASHERDLVLLGYLDGTVNEAEFGQASALVAQQRQSLQDFQRSAPLGLFQALDAKLAASNVEQLDRSRRHLTDLLKGRDSDVEGAAAWLHAANPRIASMVSTERQLVTDIANVAASLQSSEQLKAGIFGAGAFFGLVLAILLAAVLAQRITLPLRRLTLAAAEIGEELPHMVERMQTPGEGPGVVVDPIPVESGDEIGRLAAAFNTVNEVTLRVAKEQAALRASIAEMFVNVARRNQVLLGRQLSQLDKMEAREEDPDLLTNLFRLDHLATRMRRNAESLLVLAGIDSTRRLRQAMPLSDVIRTAVGEIEAYARIDPSVTDDPDVSGRHALSVAHLLAELLENATVFSNPDTRVVVASAMTGHGVDVTITDYGLGMSDEEIAEANESIAHPPVAEIAVSQRLGLFVVGRIAARLGATTSLRKGRTSGTVVTVELPLDIFEGLQVEEPNAPALESTSSTDTAVRRRLFDEPVRDEALADVPALVASVTHALSVAAGAGAASAPTAEVALFNPSEAAPSRLPEIDVAALVGSAGAEGQSVDFAGPVSTESSRRRLLPRRSRADEPVGPDDAAPGDAALDDVVPIDVVPTDAVDEPFDLPPVAATPQLLTADDSVSTVGLDEATDLPDLVQPDIAASARRGSFFQRRGHTSPVVVQEQPVAADSLVEPEFLSAADAAQDELVRDEAVSDDVADRDAPDDDAEAAAPIAPGSRRKRRSIRRRPAELAVEPGADEPPAEQPLVVEPVAVEPLAEQRLAVDPAVPVIDAVLDDHAVAEQPVEAAATEERAHRRGLFGRRQWTTAEPAVVADAVVAPVYEPVVAEGGFAPLLAKAEPEPLAWPVAEDAVEPVAEEALAIDEEPVELLVTEPPARRRGLFGRRQRDGDAPVAVEESATDTVDAQFPPAAAVAQPVASPAIEPAPAAAYYFVPAIDILPGRAMGLRGKHASAPPPIEVRVAPAAPVPTYAAPIPFAPAPTAPAVLPAQAIPAPVASGPVQAELPVLPAPTLPQRAPAPSPPSAPSAPSAPSLQASAATSAPVDVPVEQVPAQQVPIDDAPAEVGQPMPSSTMSELDQHALNTELQKSALSELRGLYAPSFNQDPAPVTDAPAGLIKRQRRAVEVVADVEPVGEPPARTRNAGEVRGMLTGFRAGVERGRSNPADGSQPDVDNSADAELTDKSTD